MRHEWKQGHEENEDMDQRKGSVFALWSVRQYFQEILRSTPCSIASPFLSEASCFSFPVFGEGEGEERENQTNRNMCLFPSLK